MTLVWQLAVGAVSAPCCWLLLARPLFVHPVHYDELLHIPSARGLLGVARRRSPTASRPRPTCSRAPVATGVPASRATIRSARLPALAGAVLLLLLLVERLVARARRLASPASAAALLLAISAVDRGRRVLARFTPSMPSWSLVMAIAAFEVSRLGTGAVVAGRMGRLSLLLVPLGWHFQGNHGHRRRRDHRRRD